MELLNHDIVHEFPEMKDKIIALKAGNAHFAKLFEKYDAANHTITKIEQGGQAKSDEEMEELKKERLILKDQIYQMLKTA